MNNKKFISLIFICLLLGCSNAVDRLKRIGKAPPMSDVVIPNLDDKKEDSLIRTRQTNSLWQPNSRSFLGENNGTLNWKVGNIIKVIIEISDRADLANSTARSNGSSVNLGAPAFFGAEKNMKNSFIKNADPNKLLSLNGKNSHQGDGSISRKESVKTQVAAIVTHVLSNGNLVIQGKQQIRVNQELREITVAGIIRPKDITANNSIHSDQIAEARITYGGKGVVSDVQSPKIGTEIMDIISPF